jgi:pyruvate dehydrogenase E2 component (dihydrolipoamide acetyltransferase)
VNTVVGTISSDGEAPAAAKAAPAPEKKAAPAPAVAAPKTESRPAARTEPAPAPPAQAHEEDEHARSSPLVRKMAREHNVNLSQVEGTGLGGRITKQDILAFIEGQSGAAVQESRATSGSPVQQQTGAPSLSSPGLARQGGDVSQPSAPAPAPRPSPAAIPGDLVPLTNMRRIIAQRMIESRRTSAHVHCMFEVDMTRIVNLRNKLKSSFEQRNGARLTFMPFFVRAAIIALQQFPIVNASLEGDGIRYHRHVNVGIAVALDWGLIVPVLKNADELNFLGLQRGITDLGERARNKKLKPEEVEGSTFTVTNPGQFGAVFGLPIINQPNSAIMGVGGITKMPLVVTDKDGADSIAIRSVVHLTLGYDHRIIDGAVADQFMAFVKKTLEGWTEDVG